METHTTASTPPPAAATTPAVEEPIPRAATTSSTTSSEGHHGLHLPHVHLPHPHMPHVTMPHVTLPHVPHPHMPEHLGESIAHAGKEILTAAAYMGPGIALLPTGAPIPATFQSRMNDIPVPSEQARDEVEAAHAASEHKRLHKPEPKHTS
ncbi:hypothetical protein AURDEDRAFT_124658 [Auricularia subglabra TFB-10046 SS5]|nr:hypothetical protein AURDEDRAFT_124658 [Auricularia subglabra TFB-10046 SS5]